jgi:hypothetical protein
VPMQSTRRMQEGVRFLWREGQRAIFGERASRNVRFGYRLLPLILVRHAHDLRLELIASEPPTPPAAALGVFAATGGFGVCVRASCRLPATPGPPRGGGVRL